MTPTHTSPDLYPTDKPPVYTNNFAPECPQPGETYLIRDTKTSLAIALKNSELGLFPDQDVSDLRFGHECRGSHWHCIENKELWLGFRNVISAGSIGHDNGKTWHFRAKEKKHRDWESFCVRPCPAGGFYLLVKHWGGFRGMKAGGERGGIFLFVKRDSMGLLGSLFVSVDLGLQCF